MLFDFQEESAPKAVDSTVDIVVISGTCCNPALKLLDDQALQVIDQATTATAVNVRVEMMTLVSAYYSTPKDVRQKLVDAFTGQRINLPAILIGGQVISYGVPALDVMKAALLAAAETNLKGTTHE